MRLRLHLVLILISVIATVVGRNHTLYLTADKRRLIDFTMFGFLSNGVFRVRIENLTIPQSKLAALKEQPLGFTLTRGTQVQEFTNNPPGLVSCPLKRENKQIALPDTLYFTFDFDKKRIKIERPSSTISSLTICGALKGCFVSPRAELKLDATTAVATGGSSNSKQEDNIYTQNDPDDRPLEKRAVGDQLANQAFNPPNKSPPKPNTPTPPARRNRTKTNRKQFLGNDPLTSKPITRLPLIFDNHTQTWSAQFVVRIAREHEEGLYTLLFHNCFNYKNPFFTQMPVTLTAHMEEKNGDSYLPAGDLLKPNLYFMISLLFLATALVWISMVHAQRGTQVYRVHYLMTALIFLKCLSLFFHGINFYFIGQYGHQREVWAVVYYIMHVVKGSLLFGTIILIGTGYTFFKNFLTERDRKLFMVVFPLQVLDNVAMVILLESETGSVNHQFWVQLFVLIDLVCCIFIIVPVIWSIKHLQEASSTDGKAAFSLGKLKLFRHFYILIITYIYVTRVIGLLVAVTAPFKYGWLQVVVQELGTWVFFVFTGYKFRPVANNPYLKLSQSDDEMEMEDVHAQSGIMENVTRLKRHHNQDPMRHTTALGLDSDSSDNDDDVIIDQSARPLVTSVANQQRTSSSANTAVPGPDIY